MIRNDYIFQVQGKVFLKILKIEIDRILKSDLEKCFGRASLVEPDKR
jgi:hypothetical protein